MTIGNFDGVHKGHKKLLNFVVKRAKDMGLSSLAMTFDPHPQKVIMGASAPPLILPLEEKVRKMGDTGLDYIVCVEFSRDFACMSPHDFVRDIVADTIGPREVYVGPNFSFGKGAKGRLKELEELGVLHGITVHGIAPQKIGREVVSSSRVRQTIQRGEVKTANRLLGYPYYLTGVVVTGTGRGHTLGYPTANIETRWELVPKEGVYGVRVWINHKSLRGALNLGTRPTFSEKRRTMEVFILDFDGDIYGQTVKIEFLERIRGEKPFASIDELKAQIADDVRTVRKTVRMGGNP